MFTQQCVKLQLLVKLFENLLMWLDKRSLYSGKTWELIWTRNLSYVCFHSVLLLSNGTLLITQVKNRNTGTYKCVGRGIRGSPVTLEASLLIAGVVKEMFMLSLMQVQLSALVIRLCIYPLIVYPSSATSSIASFSRNQICDGNQLLSFTSGRSSFPLPLVIIPCNNPICLAQHTSQCSSAFRISINCLWQNNESSCFGFFFSFVLFSFHLTM